MKLLTVWHGHSTQPSLPAGTARKGSGHLSGRRPLHLANARPFGRSKAPLGLLLLRKRELALAGGTSSSRRQQRETERSRRGTPCCTYRCCLWLLAGCVRVLGIRKTVFEKWHGNCLSGLVTSTRLGRGSIKSHVRTVKMLGMGLFAFQERVHLWKGVTH